MLCRFNSLACNPKSLMELATAGVVIRSHPRLHAKIYGTEKAVIVGSSNPSRFGLTEEGDTTGGSIEANLLTDDEGIVQDTLALFQELWEHDETERVTLAKIKREIKLRESFPTLVRPSQLKAKSLLAACREAPALFKSVFIVAYNKNLSSEGRTKLKQLQEQARVLDAATGAADFRHAWGYELSGDESLSDVGWIIDLNCCNTPARVLGASQVPKPALRLRVDDKENIDLIPTIRGIVSVPGARGSFRISSAEKDELAEVANTILNQPERLLSLAKAIALIDRKRARKHP